MRIATLDDTNRAEAVAFLRRSPYRNALPLSNATQLHARCDVYIALQEQRVVGVVSSYRDLPFLNLTFATSRDDALAPLVDALASQNPQMRCKPLTTLVPRERRDALARIATIEDARVEYQMVVEPESLRSINGHEPRRLNAADLPQLNELASRAALTTWHPSMLELGPAFGCFVGTQLVAMAATHFATPDVVEIGHIATDPAYRRRGYASACICALTQAAFRLSPRVFLMVLAENTPALEAYRRLGFFPIEPFYLTTFSLL
ncbi:MAG TPA: GNAT family N-acetyltransferase [Roseiflexaceae bacterium]|nr:GNAT family N-acetyltransferase [Roseiflexaceae bacterium]